MKSEYDAKECPEYGGRSAFKTTKNDIFPIITGYLYLYPVLRIRIRRIRFNSMDPYQK